MANNFFKVDKGVTLAPQSSVTSPQNGDVYYDSTRNTYVFRNNGQNTDFQKRSDVATASSLSSSDFTATVIQSSFVKLTGSTSGNIHGFVASADAKMFVLYNASSAIMTIKNQSVTEATAANRIILPNSADMTLAAGKALQFSYDSAQSRWLLVSSSSNSGGSGSGSKNYLSAVTTSQSTTPNTGNGDFESGSTTGWSLGTTGTLTNGIPTGSPTFGSGASGNLSLSVVSSSHIAGSYSGSLVSSAATTVGNMLASDAFYIDNSDQAKVLSWSFKYKAQSGGTNANWSGTSSNSFGVAFWDVTNSTWLNNSGSFALTQNSGIGMASGSFQTALTTTQIRMILYNVTATAGAITLYVDDFVCGPASTAQGAIITDWQSFTGNVIGTGGGTLNIGTGGGAFQTFQYRREGSDIHARYQLRVGSSGASNVTGIYIFPLPFSADSSITVSSYSTIGYGDATSTGTAAPGARYIAKIFNSNGFLLDSSDTQLATASDGIVFNNAYVISLYVIYRAAGLSSNVQMSNDTDTRVVAASIRNSGSQAVSTSTKLQLNTVVKDTHGAFDTVNNRYVAQVAGFYKFHGSIPWGTAAATLTSTVTLFKNGSATFTSTMALVSGAQGGQLYTFLEEAKPGDYFEIFLTSSTANSTLATGNTFCTMNVERISGPSVIAASETVTGRYVGCTSSITSSDSVMVFNTKDFDSHNAYSGGNLTIPISGKYQFNAHIVSITNASATTSAISIYKNGIQVSQHVSPITTFANVSTDIGNSDIIQCVPGDIITIRAANSGPTSSIIASNVRNFFSWTKVGN